jgi:hypothetical protein
MPSSFSAFFDLTLAPLIFPLNNSDATKLMKREGIRSVPAFHFWKKGAKVEVSIEGGRV